MYLALFNTDMILMVLAVIAVLSGFCLYCPSRFISFMNKFSGNKQASAAFFLLFIFPAVSLGQTAGDYQSRGTGNWNTPGTWQKYNGSVWQNNQGYPGQNPGTGTVTIRDGHTVTLNVSPTNPVGNLVIGEGSSGTLQTDNSNRILNTSGNLSVSDGATFNLGRITLTVSGTTSINGSLTDSHNNGSASFNGQFIINSNGSFSTTNNSPFTFSGGITNNGTFSKGGSGTATFAGSQAINGSGPLSFSGGNVSISSGSSVTNSGIVTIAGVLNGDDAGSQWINGANATLNYGNGSVPMSTGSLVATATNNTVNYNGTVNQSVASIIYSNLIISGSGTSTLTGEVTVENTITLASGTLSISANTLILNGSPIAGSGSLNTTTTSSLVFGGTSSGVFVPSNVSNLRNLTINNPGGVTINNNLTLSSAGELTLTSGILDIGSNTLSIANTAATAITNNSGAFVNITTGALRRTLPRNLSGTGNDYFFPVGEGGVYKGLNLIDVNTGSPEPVLSVSVSPAGALDGDNITIGPVDSRYWTLIKVSGNLTSARIELFESGLSSQKTIGMSNSVSGPYVSIGGTLNPSSMTSSVVSGLSTFFCIGDKIRSDKFYSYQTGNWNSVTTWTSDPSGTLQIGNEVPGNTDKAIILSDRTVTLTGNINTTDLELTIEPGGVLDQAGYRFTNTLAKLEGQGTLRLSSVNFPDAVTNTFITAGGGTTEYYNSSDFTIPFSPSSYNNLIINCTGRVATLLGDLTLYGNLDVKAGNFRINDNISTTKLILTINGNVTVNNAASVTVGNGATNPAIGSAGLGGSAPFLNYYLNFHTVIIRGDFTNNGTVRFTNLTYPLYTAFPPASAGPTSGAASVYFQGAADNTLTCNGTTDFYNLIVNKGTDQTYKLTINSSEYDNFRLFGANSLATESVSENPLLKKALWIHTGTLVLKGKLIIPSLTEGTAPNAHYYIPSNGALVTDGIDVVIFTTADDYREVNTSYGVAAPNNSTIGITTGGNSSLYVFGKLQINNGILSTRESGGIVTSSTASGQIIINGGTVDAKQMLGSTGSASYTQTGGLFILRGRLQRIPVSYVTIADITDISNASLGTSRINNGISTAHGSFNLENPANIYSVSGGIIRIYDVTLNTGGKAFDVKSSLSNINVTGGSLEIMPVAGTVLADATSFLIYSNAPIYDLSVNRLGSTSVAGLSTPLNVLNDLNLISGSLTANNFNLGVGGDFTIENGAAYSPGTNTTIFNGSGNQVFTINTGAALSLNALTLNKQAGDSIILAGSQNIINAAGSFNLTLGTLVDGGKTLNLSGGTIINSGIHTGTGIINLNGTAAQSIDGNGTFQNISLNNTSGTPVSLAANMTINGTLTFSNNALFNIGTYNLRLNASATIVNYGANRYILTAGNAGDGGLTRVYSSTDALVFPVGAPTITPARAAKYTPATLGFTSAPSTYGSVTVIPVGYENPNTTIKGQSLTYYWRIKSSGFSGIPLYSVTHTFVYGQPDVVGSEAAYAPALYDETAHLWYYGTTSSVNTTTNIISDWTTPTNSTNFLDGNYTAGVPSGFGTPRIYYSRRSGPWANVSTWSLTGHTVDNPPAAVPGPNDIVMIGDRDSVYLATHNTNPNTGVQNCATLLIEAGSALDIGYNPACRFAMVLSHPSGNGNFRLTTNNNTGAIFAFPSGDFSDFNANRGTTELYTTNPTAGTTYYMQTGISSYGNLILSPLGGSNLIFPNNDVTIYGNLITRGQNADSWFVPAWQTTYPGNVQVIPKTITIMGNMDIQGGALIWYGSGNRAQDFVIHGDVKIGVYASLYVYSGATNQSMAIGGNLINDANGQINGSGVTTVSKADFNNIPLTFFGPNSSAVTNTTGMPSTTFGSVTVNKGSSQETTLTINIAGTLNTPANNWLNLLNGTLIYNRVGNLTISQGTDFTIPATSGLVINTPSNVYIANNNAINRTLFLDGRLAITGGDGNVYIGPAGNSTNNADIEYSGSGASQLDIQAGNLYVNGQIRRPLASTNGILNYSQTGGNVYIFGNNPTTTNLTKAKLEVLNEGSSFTMTGGILTIVRGGGTTFGDLYLRPSSSSVTGGTIIFTQVPSSGPVIDAPQSYSLDANIPLNNLTITGKTAPTRRAATLALMVSSLSLNGSLTLTNSYSIFNSNDLNISLKGDLNNNGTYNYGTNLTTFNGGAQFITGSSTSDFHDLDVLSLTTLTVSNSFTVGRNLRISNGDLVLGSNRVTVIGNLVNNGSYTDNNSSGGITLAGTTRQQISGTGLFGLLDINNTEGARLYSDINLRNNLVLSNGVLDINMYLLTLSQNSIISGAPFSDHKMIMPDGVVSSPGVKKFFNAGPQNFVFPMGVSDKYTPANFSITASSSVGFIRVNTVNSTHPSVTDPLNALKYYWQIENSGITGIDAVVQLSYDENDVYGSESSYVAARLELPSNIWHEALPGPSTDNVDEAGNLISYSFNSADNLNGDYTAGDADAIPGEVPTYQSNSDGLWSNAVIWTPLGASPPCPPGGPVGALVIINHTVTVNTNRIYVFSTTINNRLRILSPTFGHNLGYVSGNGTLYLESGNLPGGNYSSFTDCAGTGTVEYGGSGSYNIIATLFSSLPNVRFSGTGTRVLPNKDLTVCRRMVIDGPTLDNSVNNRSLYIMGTMERYNTGAFRSGSGPSPSATVIFSGTSVQSIGGATGNFTGTNKFYNFEISNPAGLIINTGGAVEVGNELLLTNGVITTGPAASLTLLNTSPSAVTPGGGSANSYISGPLTKYIARGEEFSFPLGKGAIKGHSFVVTSSAFSTMPFTVEFFTPNPTATSVQAPLKVTNTGEYWTVKSTSSTSAKIRIAWDPQSDLTPLMAANGLADMRVAQYVSGRWTQITSVAAGTVNNGTVETRFTVTISATEASFTSACLSGTLARAAFGVSGYICGSSGIPLVFTSFNPINLNYTIGYTINGTPQTPVTVTALPFTLPTPSPGIYKLTSFRFNNGLGTGVVDAQTVTVYATPPASMAGPDQSLCGLSSATLAGNNPTPYAGLWTIVNGTGGSFVNSSQYNTVFNGVLGNAYTLRWTISNGPCRSSDDVVISFPVVASTPADFTSAPPVVCQGSTGNIYSVPAVAGIIYTWSYTGTGHTIHGTGNAVSIDFGPAATGGTLSVTATNNCGTSQPRSIDISIPSAGFRYNGSPFCQNDPDPLPILDQGSMAGTFSSSSGLVFLNTSTGQIDLSASSSGTFIVTNTVSTAVCGTLTATASVTISGLTWSGAASTDWNTPGNWSCGYVPYPATHVVIPNVTRKPVLNTGISGTVNNLTIEAGSSLVITGGTLQVSGTITNNGTFDASAGTVELAGTAPQTIGAGIFSGNTVQNLNVNNASGVTIAGALNVTGIVKVTAGSLASDGFLTLVSTNTGTALIDGSGAGQVTGNVTMQRYLSPAYGYKYISSPFLAATVAELDDDRTIDPWFATVYRYDENNIVHGQPASGWVEYETPSGILSPLSGYSVNFGDQAAAKTIDISGVVNNGNLSVTLYNHNQPYTTGFNLVGNPYPSPVNWSEPSGWIKTNLDNSLYFFRASSTDPYEGTYSTWVNGVSSDGFVSNIIPSMQGFFVHVANGPPWPVTATLSVNNNARVTSLSPNFAKSGEVQSGSLLRLTASLGDDSDLSDPMVIYFSEKASRGFDSELDALKLMNTDYYTPSLYSFSADSRKLSINALPVSYDSIYSIPLGIKTSTDGYAVFMLAYADESLSGWKIVLTDHKAGTEHDLTRGEGYRVFLEAGECNNRFTLEMTPAATGIPEVNNDVIFTVYSSHGIVKSYIDLEKAGTGYLKLFNLAGQLLFVEKITATGYNEFHPGLKDGIYIATYASDKFRSSRKLIINNQ